MFFRKHKKNSQNLVRELADLLYEKSAVGSLQSDKVNSLLDKAILGVAGQDTDRGRPSEEAILSYSLGIASEQQEAEVREALLGSKSIRLELGDIARGINNLSETETRCAFDMALPDRIPESPKTAVGYALHVPMSDAIPVLPNPDAETGHVLDLPQPNAVPASLSAPHDSRHRASKIQLAPIAKCVVVTRDVISSTKEVSSKFFRFLQGIISLLM